MLTEIINMIYLPKSEDDWILIGTQDNIYSLRMGGFKKEDQANVNMDSYKEVEKFSPIFERINKVYTDEYFLYILLENNFVIAAGLGGIDNNGNTYFTIDFKKIEEYEPDFFNNSMYSLSIDLNGNSCRADYKRS